jgi:hypothetical protein
MGAGDEEPCPEGDAIGGFALSVSRILDWVVAHHAETGHWPTRGTGLFRTPAGFECWTAIDRALSLGMRGLPGGQSLAGLLQECAELLAARTKDHRGAPAGSVYAKSRWPFAAKQRLTVARILAWADAYHAAHGRWPNAVSGPIAGVPGETWAKIDVALKERLRGLKERSTLKYLLRQHRGLDAQDHLPPLSVEKVLQWAGDYHLEHGVWPTARSGPVGGVPGLDWSTIHALLKRGGRGLPAKTKLARLLAERYGASRPRLHTLLNVDQILAWADAHHAQSGSWPTCESGPVAVAWGECWSRIDGALRNGCRGLPGGSSLRRLLEEHRPTSRRVLDLETIRHWARAHRELTGRWPSVTSGPVVGAPPGESWSKIDAALRTGRYGLPGGSSLAQLVGRRNRST